MREGSLSGGISDAIQTSFVHCFLHVRRLRQRAAAISDRQASTDGVRSLWHGGDKDNSDESTEEAQNRSPGTESPKSRHKADYFGAVTVRLTVGPVLLVPVLLDTTPFESTPTIVNV